MKNIKAIVLEKYNNSTEYRKLNEYVYKNLSDGNFRITLSCELENDEDSQYPLEDILDKYYVNCTDYFEEKKYGSIRTLIFELEGSLNNDEDNYVNIMEVSKIIGKQVYNKEENGYIKLIIV
jgi:hypothetical protein